MSYTNFKEITADNVGTTARYGGNDLKEVMRILNGTVVAGRRPKILNEWIWLDHFDMSPPGSAPGSPPDANTSRLYVDPSDFRVKIKKTDGTVRDLENFSIPDTALNAITNRAKLPTAIMYNDVNNTLNNRYLDIVAISTPSNPISGTRRVFVDTATNELSVRTAAGVTQSLETGGGGGGGGDVFLNQANVHGDFDNTFRSTRLRVANPANTFFYNFTTSAITANRAVTIPLLTAGDTMVTAAFAQTLTNKTLVQTNNTLHLFDTTATRKYIIKVPDGLPAGADLTIEMPSTTVNDSLLSASGTVTLANKTINVDTNTVRDSAVNAAGDILKGNGTKFVRLARGAANQVLSVNAGGTDIVWATAPGGGGTGNVSTTQANVYGDFDQIFRSGRLDVRNPADTFSYNITGSAITADRAWTLPLLTANDVAVSEAHTQTLTNKTLTAPIISTISNGGTIALPSGNETLVGRATTDTLTNKTVNSTDNTITATSQATGDILKNNGTKFVRMARGTALQVLRTNSAATDLEFASLDSERTGKATASGNGTQPVFTIAHGLGALPSYAFVDCSSHSIARTWTVDSTNITVTFASAPPSGTNNVIIYWRVIA